MRKVSWSTRRLRSRFPDITHWYSGGARRPHKKAAYSGGLAAMRLTTGACSKSPETFVAVTLGDGHAVNDRFLLRLGGQRVGDDAGVGVLIHHSTRGWCSLSGFWAGACQSSLAAAEIVWWQRVVAFSVAFRRTRAMMPRRMQALPLRLK